jgi:hypothetical protein
MNFNATAGGLTVTLPDATQTSVGAQFYAANIGANNFTMNDFEGDPLGVIVVGSYSIFYLADNSTPQGTWFRIQGGGGFSAVTSVNAVALGANSLANLTINGAPPLPITGVGTIQFQFAGDLASIINFGAGTGFAVRNLLMASPDSWVLRTLQGSANQIVITNGDGVAANPNIALANDIKFVNSIQAGSLQMGGGNVLSAFTGDNITLSPSNIGVTNTTRPIQLLPTLGVGAQLQFVAGSGLPTYVSIQGPDITVPANTTYNLKLPESAPAAGQALYNIGGGPAPGTPFQLGWANFSSTAGATVAGTLPVYTNNAGGLGDTNIAVDALDNVSNMNTLTLSGNSLGFSIINPGVISSGIGSPIVISPLAGQPTNINSNLMVISSGGVVRSLILNNATNDGSGGFNATGTPGATNNLWQLPPSVGTLKSIMTTGALSTNQLTFSSTIANPGVTTDNICKAYAIVSAAGVIGGNSINVTSVGAPVGNVFTVVLTNALANTNYTFSAVVAGANNGYVSNFTPTGVSSFSYATYQVTPGTPANITATALPVTFQVFGQFAT